MLGRCAEELSKFLGIKRDEVLNINQVTHVDSNETLLALKHMNMTSLFSLSIGEASILIQWCQMAQRVGHSEAIVISRQLEP